MVDENHSKTQKRFIFNLSKDLHAQIKSRAAYRNISMRKWIIRAIYDAIKKEDQYRSDHWDQNKL